MNKDDIRKIKEQRREKEGRKYIFKIIVLGSPGVGKSSLISRYVHNRFESSYMITIGVDILSKQLFIDEDEVLFLISDIGGQQRFSGVREKFYRGAKGCFLVFDLTREDTLEAIKEWKRGLGGVEEDVLYFLVGNKSDLKEQIAVTEEEIYEIVDKIGLSKDSFFMTSAKTGEKVEEAFVTFAKELIKSVERRRIEVGLD